MLDRLTETIAAVCPIHGVSGTTNTRIDYRDEATEQQRTAAQAALAAFDWSDGAHQAWKVAQLRANSLTEIASSRDETIVLLRGVIEAMVGMLNRQSIWDGQVKTALANSATFAAFKTAMAAIQSPAVVSKADVRQAIANEINAGKADG